MLRRLMIALVFAAVLATQPLLGQEAEEAAKAKPKGKRRAALKEKADAKRKAAKGAKGARVGAPKAVQKGKRRDPKAARLADVERGLKFAVARAKGLEARMENMTAEENELAQAELKIWNERIGLLKQQLEAVKNDDRAADMKLDGELKSLWLDWQLVNGRLVDLRLFNECVKLAEKEGDEELLKAAKEYYAMCEEYRAKQKEFHAVSKDWSKRRKALERSVAPYRRKAAAERAEARKKAKGTKAKEEGVE